MYFVHTDGGVVACMPELERDRRQGSKCILTACPVRKFPDHLDHMLTYVNWGWDLRQAQAWSAA